jgi:hypothetical protein
MSKRRTSAAPLHSAANVPEPPPPVEPAAAPSPSTPPADPADLRACLPPEPFPGWDDWIDRAVVSDVPDLGPAPANPQEFWEWCRTWSDWLEQFRSGLGQSAEHGERAPEYPFRFVPEIIRQCRRYVTRMGATVPDRFAFASIPECQDTDLECVGAMEFDRFLWFCANSVHDRDGEIYALVRRVIDFLTWAMGWCKGLMSEAELPTVESLGSRSYKVGSHAFAATVPEDLVLQAFVGCPALSQDTLAKRSKFADKEAAPKVLSGIKKNTRRRKPRSKWLVRRAEVTAVR